MGKFEIQDTQYQFPYHYIPHVDANGDGHRIRVLGWGFEYLCYQKHAQIMAAEIKPSTVLEVGCGDGFFIGNYNHPGVRRLGVDLSKAAIRFAKAFHENVEFLDVDAKDIGEQFDLVASIEVLEHIPDSGVSDFLRTLFDRTKQDGYILLSVPTKVMALNPKHYRHYNLSLLEKQIEESGIDVQIERVDYVYKHPFAHRLYDRLSMSRFWYLELHFIRRWLWRHIWEKCRLADSSNGRHMMVKLKKMEARR